jgi:hypothetical protein
MFVHLFHEDGFNRAVLTNEVDCAVGVVEPDSAMSLPFAFEGVVAKSRNGSSGHQAFEFDEISPESELFDNVFRQLGKLLPREGG